MVYDVDVNARLAAAAPVEVLPREDLIRECRALREQLSLAVDVAEAARWACVAVLDSQTPAAELTTVRPMVAEQLLDALKAYDDDRTNRGIVSVAKV